MAFIGILFVSWILVLLLIFIAFVVFFIYIPCTVISIINLVQGIKHHWRKRNIIPLAITAPIVMVITGFIIWYFIWRFTIYVPPYEGSSSSETIDQINNICLYIQGVASL